VLAADDTRLPDDLVDRGGRGGQIGAGDLVAGPPFLEPVELPAAELDADGGEHQDRQRGGDPADVHQATHISNLSHPLKPAAATRPRHVGWRRDSD
jgi:hypothetical protein